MSEAQTGTPQRVAVVTGGARRLGRHLCSMLARRGYAVVVLYRGSHDDAATLVEEIETQGGHARALSVDIGVEPQVKAVFEDIAAHEGAVDLLVNNVGNYNPQHVTRLDPSVWDATIASNLSGAYYCCFHALRLLRDAGNIIKDRKSTRLNSSH